MYFPNWVKEIAKEIKNDPYILIIIGGFLFKVAIVLGCCWAFVWFIYKYIF